MSDRFDDEAPATGVGARRAFLRRASQVAVTTPAVMLLLSAGSKTSAGILVPSGICAEGDNADTEPGLCDGIESDFTSTQSGGFVDGTTSGDGPSPHNDA